MEYPKAISSNVFRVDFGKAVHEVRYAKPVEIASRRDAEQALDFSPVIPKNLPFGFQLQDMQVREGGSSRSIMTRITDGLARATVYQWRADRTGTRMKPLDDFSVAERNGVKVMIVSDLDEDIRIKLLRAFLSQLNFMPELPEKLFSRDFRTNSNNLGTEFRTLVFFKTIGA